MSLHRDLMAPIIQRAVEPTHRDDGTLRRFGPFVARLTCAHDLGSGPGYMGESAYPGETVPCPRCATEPAADGAVKEAPEPSVVVDVVYSGPLVDAAGRRW